MAKPPKDENALPTTVGDANARSEETGARSSVSTEPRDAGNETAAIEKQIDS
jgi:hypothetical protein